MQKSKGVGEHTRSLRKVESTTRKKNKCGSSRKRGRTTRKGNMFTMEESESMVSTLLALSVLALTSLTEHSRFWCILFFN